MVPDMRRLTDRVEGADGSDGSTRRAQVVAMIEALGFETGVPTVGIHRTAGIGRYERHVAGTRRGERQR